MIELEGKHYFPYVLYTDHGPVMGLDERPSADVEAEWLARAKKGAERRALQGRASARAEVHNLRLLQQKISGDPALGEVPGNDAGPVTLDEVAQPSAASFDEDELFRLHGIPGGYGYVAILGIQISGISRAGGQQADDFCAGVDTWFAQPPRVARKSGGKAKGKGKKWSGGK